MKNAQKKIQLYRLYESEPPILCQRDDAGVHVYINDKWIDKVEIDLAIKQLPPKERAIIDILYIKGIQPRRAMVLLGVDRTTIWRREKRARQKLLYLLKNK